MGKRGHGKQATVWPRPCHDSPPQHRNRVPTSLAISIRPRLEQVDATWLCVSPFKRVIATESNSKLFGWGATLAGA